MVTLDKPISTKCTTCPISCGCSWGCIRGDDLAEIYVIRAALRAVTRSLIGAISIIEHTPQCKKAMPSDKMFNQALKDMKKNLKAAHEVFRLDQQQGKD